MRINCVKMDQSSKITLVSLSLRQALFGVALSIHLRNIFLRKRISTFHRKGLKNRSVTSSRTSTVQNWKFSCWASNFLGCGHLPMNKHSGKSTWNLIVNNRAIYARQNKTHLSLGASRIRRKLSPGLELTTDTVANVTNIFSLATKNSGSVTTLATRFLYDLDLN